MLYSRTRKGCWISATGHRGWNIEELKNGNRIFFVGQHFIKEDSNLAGYAMQTREHDSLESCKDEINSR